MRLHVGRRGLYLISSGTLFAGYGYSLDIVQADRLAPYALATRIAPLSAWAVAWGLVGALAVLCGLIRRGQPLAFAGLMALSSIWTMSFLTAQPLFDGPPRTWVGGLLFGSLVVSIAIVSGWPEVRE